MNRTDLFKSDLNQISLSLLRTYRIIVEGPWIRRFHREMQNIPCNIVLRFLRRRKLEENASLGVIVDEVREVVNLSEDEIDKVSNKGRFINGIGKHGDQLISLLEINALVEENN